MTASPFVTDSHCHLDRLRLESYDNGLDGALHAARERGVGRMLCIGIDYDNSMQVVEIANQYADVFATVGIHPMEYNEDDFSFDENRLRRWLQEHGKANGVIGIGETGLDYYYTQASKEAQNDSFRVHLQVAAELGKPVIVHSRDAREDTLALIRQFGSSGSAGVMHCFTESWDMAKSALDLGYLISFSGIITFNNAGDLREVVKKVPLDRILVETDSPYLAPIPFRGKPNEPKNVVEVAKCVAELKEITYEAVCEATNLNFEQLFGL